MSRISKRLRALTGAALICFAASASAQDADSDGLPKLGLMGSIPIYWGEAEDIEGLLGGDAAPHWARAQLERGYRLEPLDTLAGDSLAGLDFLLLAQPRALSPAENVALDTWVRAGGRVLLFADPMLTGRSRFAIGDRRRPQDVILLSPILDHWGLRLEFDIGRAPGIALVESGGAVIPVNLPGQFADVAGDSDCTIEANAILARCRIGAGRAIVLADAAMLDLHDAHWTASPALDWLLEQAFASHGENAGEPAGLAHNPN